MKWFAILTIIAIVLALGLPPDPASVQQLHTTSALYRLAIAAVLIPYVLIWYTGFYAFAKMGEYSGPLKGTKDGDAFRKITLGLGALAFALVVPTILSLIIDNIAVHHPSFKTTSEIINNYLQLYPGLVAFLLLLNGSRLLVRTARGATQKLDIRYHAIWFLLLCVVFSHLTIENQHRTDTYHLSIGVLIVTFIVPFLYAWTVGLLSAYNLSMYARTVKGLLYKKAVMWVANGIAIAILGSIAIQFVNITIGERLKSLGIVLLIDYGLLAIVAAGMILIALGTKKLKLIEEI